MAEAAMKEDTWGTGAEHWAENQERFRMPFFETMIEALAVGPHTFLLDAGCGTGGVARAALRKGARVAGIDASPGMIAYAAKSLPGGDFRVADLEHNPFAEHTFDAVVAADSVQFAKDSVAAVKELARVCKPEGCVVIGTWDAMEKSDHRFIHQALAELTGAGLNPFAVAAAGIVESMLRQAGLSIRGGSSVPVVFRYAD